MPTLTRNAIAVAVAFVLVATYGACVTALVASKYGPLLEMPKASVASIAAIVVAVLGLARLAWAPSYKVNLALLVLASGCCGVLLGFAIRGALTTSEAIAVAPTLPAYQQRMTSIFASDEARQFNYSDSLGINSRLPSPTLSTNGAYYPFDAASVFAEAYCIGQGDHFCSALPLTQTIVYPGLWLNPNVTADVARNLSVLPTTFANVTVTDTTTIASFCAAATIAENDHMTPFETSVRQLCSSCATLAKLAAMATTHDALKTWIDDTCPMTSAKPSGVYCIATAKCLQRDIEYPGRGYDYFCYANWPYTYMNPSFDVCFGSTLMSTVRQYDVAIAVVSSLLLLVSLVLAAYVWRTRRGQDHADTAVQTPKDTV
ncbi:hypothetical protein SDRG_04501 [Saprolegnia diclina VS20]|uniref:Uncharacterized protein n=1 Tax=Saprolegnia diclina (strain VS20) TaxID=1156394 RepID=T0QTP1_SAPDV|nr:hypothetical protein SDRG_04501 [Saprolegnia diclina VS20]EQC38071.1 hypothetical protein SDRG_04501 [Saprolegnia diclina VS20]|eukprot:XP_008608398.1 hypothetical protein SDRG_04501 [Saprolegnia diclina VS20]